MKNQFKRTLILTITGVLIATAPTVSVSAASTKTNNVIKNTEQIIEINTETIEKITETTTENSDIKVNDTIETKDNEKVNDTTETKDIEKIDDTTKTNNDTKVENTTETKDDKKTDNNKETKNDTKETAEKSTTTVKKMNYITKTLTITKNSFVADTLNGVPALYRTGRNDGSSSTYSCAAFVKRYYKEVYGVTVMNLLSGRTPSSSKGSFKSVSTPQVGDVVACRSTSGSNHWAIVKQVNDNNTVTLIEQNWKWTQGRQTLCKTNRSISISSGKFYRLYK